MKKPIRCTTHFHACDCREYEFEQLRKDIQEKDRIILSQEKERQKTEAFWKKKLCEIQDEKDAEIEKLISCLADILTFKGPEYLKVINGKPVSIFSLVRECLQEERIKSFHAGYASQKEKIEDLQKENQEMREALGKTRKELVTTLNFLHSMGWQHYNVEEPEFQCQYSLSETIFRLHNTNLSETTNKEIEE